MEPFKFIRAQDSAGAVGSASVTGAKFIAGGTNMIDLMKLNIERPREVVDINKLKLSQI